MEVLGREFKLLVQCFFMDGDLRKGCHYVLLDLLDFSKLNDVFLLSPGDLLQFGKLLLKLLDSLIIGLLVCLNDVKYLLSVGLPFSKELLLLAFPDVN